jgi:hypothetical protein
MASAAVGLKTCKHEVRVLRRIALPGSGKLPLAGVNPFSSRLL